ncbi:MAG: hypothetical protein NTW66_03600 [Candidatus Magasanikbacteria bacterium]|nr:hypothetical protein [Candidatus Magasanikbacteria bacterium]
MTLRQYLIIMSLATLVCWSVWFLVVFIYNPNSAGLVGFLLFYTSLFLSVLGTFSIIGFFIRAKIIKNDDIVFRHIKRTFRQGFFFGIFVVLNLLLAQFRLLTWWNFILLLTCYIFLEGLIFTNRKYQNRNYVK